MVQRSIMDITPRRTVRDIPVPIHRRQQTRVEQEFNEVPPTLPPQTPRRNMRFFRLPKIFIIVLGVLVLGGLWFVVDQFFRVQATVSVTQKQKEIILDGTFIAKKDAQGIELPFEVISLNKELSKSIPSTGEKDVEARASGTIIVYNDYSTASQRLIKNTRFETGDGKIYRINESIVVPGKNTTTNTPGSIETVVYADSAGSEYNIGLSDFTIPGFKGDPRFEKFYARSKAPMAGGFRGKIKTASKTDVEKTKTELREALKTELSLSIKAQVPEGFVLLEGATYFEFESLSPEDSNDIKEKTTAYGLLFRENKVSSEIARATVSDYDGGEVLASNLSTLVFTPIPSDAKPWQTGVVSFSLKGTTTLIWVFDEEKLKIDLVGQPKEKARIATVLQAYPSIDNAEVVVRPFWRGTMPEDVLDIKIKIK